GEACLRLLRAAGADRRPDRGGHRSEDGPRGAATAAAAMDVARRARAPCAEASDRRSAAPLRAVSARELSAAIRSAQALRGPRPERPTSFKKRAFSSSLPRRSLSRRQRSRYVVVWAAVFCVMTLAIGPT